MSKLMTGDRSGSLLYALRLSEQVKKEKDPELAEGLLYPYLLRITSNDGAAAYRTEIYFKLSSEEMATAWYSLANVYDRRGEYPEAYAACQKVLEHLPATDHASDVYGISIHARYLMDKLRPVVKGGI